MNFRTKATACVAVLVISALPAWGGQQGRSGAATGGAAQMQNGQQTQQKMQKKFNHPGTCRKVSGEIIKEKEVSVKKQNVKHKVVMLKLDKGKRAIVDLGPTQDLKGLNLKRGQKIDATGYMMRAGSRPVLFAGQVTSNGNTIDITRHKMAPKQVKGEVVNKKKVGFKGKQQQNDVVMLRTDQGKMLIVDLGPSENLTNVNTEKGTSLAVVAHPAIIGEQLVWIADAVIVAGNQQPVKRSQKW